MDEKLQKAVEQIKMPPPMRERILQNSIKTEKRTMNKKFYQRPLALVSVLALLVCVIGVTALAATGNLQGFLRDLKRWDGAIVGEVYEQATNEIAMTATPDEKGVLLTVTLLKPDQAPYSVQEFLGLSKYTLTDKNGKEYNEPLLIEAAKIVDGQVNLLIPQKLPKGEYRLTVTEFLGSKKAEQVLCIRGLWECTFSITE